MDNRGNIVIFQTKDGKISIDVKLENETVWLTLNQIAELFSRDKSVISRHISNVFNEGELERNSVVAKNATTASDGKMYQVEYFNLDVISAKKRFCCFAPMLTLSLYIPLFIDVSGMGVSMAAEWE